MPAIQQYLLWVVLVTVFLFYPTEINEIIFLLALKGKIAVLNVRLFILTVFIYLRLVWAFKRLGLDAPKFKFTPVGLRSDV